MLPPVNNRAAACVSRALSSSRHRPASHYRNREPGLKLFLARRAEVSTSVGSFGDLIPCRTAESSSRIFLHPGEFLVRKPLRAVRANSIASSTYIRLLWRASQVECKGRAFSRLLRFRSRLALYAFIIPASACRIRSTHSFKFPVVHDETALRNLFRKTNAARSWKRDH